MLTLSVQEMDILLMKTGWIQSSCRVTRQLAQDPTYLPHRLPFPNQEKAEFQDFEK